MARLSYIVLIVTMNALLCIFAEEELYPVRYDNIDIQAIIQNDDLREEYNKCFMEIASCNSPEQKAILGIFIEAIQTKCKKCTEKQKEMIEQVADWYIKNEPEKWQLILAKSIEYMKNANQ